jgi:hypothetical protein
VVLYTVKCKESKIATNFRLGGKIQISNHKSVLIKDKNSPSISVGLIAQQVEQWTKFLKIESSNLVFL